MFANLSSRCSDASLSCLSLLLRIVALLAARIKFCYCPDSFFRSLSFYVVALLAARHCVAVELFMFLSLSFDVVALLAARRSVVDCSCPCST